MLCQRESKRMRKQISVGKHRNKEPDANRGSLIFVNEKYKEINVYALTNEKYLVES